MEVDHIINYHDLVTEEKFCSQNAMNFGVGNRRPDLERHQHSPNQILRPIR